MKSLNLFLISMSTLLNFPQAQAASIKNLVPQGIYGTYAARCGIKLEMSPSGDDIYLINVDNPLTGYKCPTSHTLLSRAQCRGEVCEAVQILENGDFLYDQDVSHTSSPIKFIHQPNTGVPNGYEDVEAHRERYYKIKEGGIYATLANRCALEVETNGRQLILTHIDNPLIESKCSNKCSVVGSTLVMNCSKLTNELCYSGEDWVHVFPDGSFAYTNGQSSAYFQLMQSPAQVGNKVTGP